MQRKYAKSFFYRKEHILKIINNSKNGFTLIELLISIVISSIIAIGVGSVYYSIRSTQNAQTSVSELRDNSFIALDRIESAIKHANFIEYGDQRYNPNESYMPVSSPIVNKIGTDGTSHTTNTTINNTSDTFTVEVSSPDKNNEMV